MYFPLILIVYNFFPFFGFPIFLNFQNFQLVEVWESPFIKSWLESATIQEKRNLFICVLWILKHCNKSLLVTWWKQTLPNRLCVFLELLAECVVAFEVIFMNFVLFHPKFCSFKDLKEKINAKGSP